MTPPRNAVAAAPVESDAPDPPLNRQQERSQLSTKRLLEAAGEIIDEGGLAAMTLATVGERAGYSRGLVTVRFGSKDKLLEALVERITTGWSHRNVIPRTKGHRGLDSLLIIIDAIRTQAERDSRGLRVLYALMFESLGPNFELRSRFVDLHRTMRADFVELLRQGQKDGSVRKGVNAKAEAAMLVATIRGLGYQWMLDPEEFDLGASLKHLGAATESRLRA